MSIPIVLHAPGTLSLKAELIRIQEGHVNISGRFGYSLSDSLDMTLDKLPFGLGKSFSRHFIHKILLDERNYYFKVANLLTVDCYLNQNGQFRMKADYKSPVRSIVHSETARVFDRFADVLAEQGITPSVSELMSEFTNKFERHRIADLDFIGLFEGRKLQIPDHPTYYIHELRAEKIHMGQDPHGDLEVHFEAVGRLDIH